MALSKVEKDDYEVRGEYKHINVRTKTSIMEDSKELSYSKYADKKGKTADFKSKEKVVQEAISEVKDEDGKVVRQAVAEKKEAYIAMIEKRWDAESGEALADSERQWSLSELESEKARYDADMARAKEYSDGLASAIADFKKL